MQWVYTHAVAKSTFVAFSLLECFFFLIIFLAKCQMSEYGE